MALVLLTSCGDSGEQEARTVVKTVEETVEVTEEETVEAPEQTVAGSEYEEGVPLTSGEEQALDLATCQLAEAQAEMSPEEFAAFEQEVTDELIAALERGEQTDIQTILYERGYDCNGQAQEILGR